MTDRGGILREMLVLVRQRKRYWLVPLVLVVVFFVLLIILGGTGDQPTIYTIF